MATGVATEAIRQSDGSANSLDIDALAHFAVDDHSKKQIGNYIEEESLEDREVTHNEKKIIFGTGELAKSIASDLSTSTLHFHSQTTCDDRLSQMQQQLEECEAREKLAEQTQELQEALRAQQCLFEQFMSQSRGDADHPPPS